MKRMDEELKVLRVQFVLGANPVFFRGIVMYSSHLTLDQDRKVLDGFGPFQHELVTLHVKFLWFLPVCSGNNRCAPQASCSGQLWASGEAKRSSGRTPKVALCDIGNQRLQTNASSNDGSK